MSPEVSGLGPRGGWLPRTAERAVFQVSWFQMRKLRHSESKHLVYGYTSDGGPSNPGSLCLRSASLSLRAWASGLETPLPAPCCVST